MICTLANNIQPLTSVVVQMMLDGVQEQTFIQKDKKKVVMEAVPDSWFEIN